ncbi:coatomer subunit beta [Dimargaris cristalligena]|nr:coatomer subunit beta [Dimargaris cristalligena]
MSNTQCYFLVAPDDTQDQPSLAELKKDLERNNEHVKINTMRKILIMMLNGEPYPELLMHVIRFVMPSKNKILKKLLHFYWEICPKTNPDGKLRQEMILVCNAIRNDLQHPNEYIRGATLRFLCKIHETEILEPLLPSVRSCLEHRHSYVRKNAVFAIHSISKHSPQLIPDAAELVYNFLVVEADMACRRNAFVTLCSAQPDLAAQYLKEHLAQVVDFEELFQLSVIDFIRKDGRNNTTDRNKFIRCIFELLDSPAHSVKYEAATTLVSLTSNPTAVKAAASCFINLIVSESDNNVKIIVLDRLEELHRNNNGVLNDLVMDVLRVLSSADLEVRRKALAIAMDLTNQRNIQDVVQFLKKELARTQDQSLDLTPEYRHLLIRTIHSCAIRFSEAATEVVHALMDSINEFSSSSAVDVINFVREVVEKFPDLRAGIIERLLDSFLEFKSGQVLRGALWILGEYALDVVTIDDTWAKLREAVGEIPMLAAEQRLADEANPATGGEADSSVPLGDSSSSRRILPDGTYATESSLSMSAQKKTGTPSLRDRPCIRALLLKGDFFLGSTLASTLAKLVIRYRQLISEAALVNARRAEAMLIMTGMVRLGHSSFVTNPIDEDSRDRILFALRSLDSDNFPEEDPTATPAFLDEYRNAFTRLLAEDDGAQAQRQKAEGPATVQPDELITFSQFAKKTDLGVADTYDIDVLRATGDALRTEPGSKLNTIVQLTGFSDPVYAEAYVNINQYDIMLDVLIVNQTSETLRNMAVEFTTLGDLKLVEKPTEHNLAPHGFYTLQAHIKVSSTETGVIFGTIYYDGQAAGESTCVVLSDIHIDIMEYIQAAHCDESRFREMWTEFEWENKVSVNTQITDLRTYLNHIMRLTNMSCLTPENALSGDCGFISANLYARSIFGEDALASLSIEQHEQGPISGHIRIRSKTQGIALNLGDKISMGQKEAAAH